MRIQAVVLACALLPAARASVVPSGDAVRGAQLFETAHCVACHSVAGKGGTAAPDLGRRGPRGYTPFDMARLLWNHAPAMWSAAQKAGMAQPALTAQQAADLFAYFFAARYFERPGDAARGRKLFTARGCAGCHAVPDGGAAAGPSVEQWESIADPIELSRLMWNHAPAMRAAMGARKLPIPLLSAAEFNDITVYLQGLPQTRRRTPQFSTASAETGAELFRLKGCAECHRGAGWPASRLAYRTTGDFAAAMWNHTAKLPAEPARLNPEEMRRIVGYVWSLQFDAPRGAAARGRRVFESKGCAGCHTQAGVPRLTGQAGAAHPFALVAGLLAHGPAMQRQLQARKAAWPRFDAAQLADLLAYLNQR